MANKKIGRQTPTQAVIMPYLKMYGDGVLKSFIFC